MNTFVRFIYIYREKSTGRAIYVGSAFDPKQRDEQHCKSIGLPFDREIQRRGRAAFTFHIVEALSAPTAWAAEKAAAARENHWMSVLGTYRTPGCFNYAPAFVRYDSEECREARNAAASASLKIAMGMPEARAANSAAQKIAQNRPEVKERHKAALKVAWADREVRARHSAAMKIAMNRPEVKARNSAAMKIIMGKKAKTLEWRAQRSKIRKALLDDPVWSAAHSKRSSENMKKLNADPVFAAARDERLKKKLTDPAFKKFWAECSRTPAARVHRSVAAKKREARKRAERLIADALISEIRSLCTVAQHQSENDSKSAVVVSQDRSPDAIPC